MTPYDPRSENARDNQDETRAIPVVPDGQGEDKTELSQDTVVNAYGSASWEDYEAAEWVEDEAFDSEDGSASGARMSEEAMLEQEASFQAEQLTAEEHRRERKRQQVRRSIRKQVSGKPTPPAGSRTYAGVVVHAIGVAFKISLVTLLAIIVLVGGIGLGALVGYVSTAEPIQAEMLTSFDETSYIYDNQNNLMAIQTGRDNVNRTVISFSEVRDTYIDDAFIAVEDQRFHSNIGIDPRRIASAVISALINSGQPTHGGSTITQQTVKMLTGDDDVSISRKVQEWYAAVRLTEQLSKWEIMELYLNLVPMANSYVGVQAGAQAYFAKDASELNLAESAFLAGIPKSPVSYNPYREDGKKNALRRQRVILGMMLSQERISEEEYQAAMNYELVFRQEPQDFSGTDIQSYFTEYAIQETIRGLQEHRGYSESLARQLVSSGGVSIYTTMEPHAQEALDATYQKQELFQADPDLYIDLPEQPEAGTVIINNQTGAIAAMQGGYGDKPGNLVTNRATDIRRSPGSTIKPVAVYAPAIEMGIATGATIIRDEEAYLNPDRPDLVWPRNAYDNFRGDMTMRNSLKISNNVPVAKLLNLIGVDNSKYYMRKVGLNLDNDPVGMAIAVGTLTDGLSPLQIASSFTVFPNGGLYSKPYSVKQVLDSRNNVLFENKPAFDQVYTAETAFQMSKIMEEVVQRKTSAFWYPGSAADYGYITNSDGEHIDTAAKTGTTDQARDKWMALFTPYYSSATWYGFDNRIRTSFVTPTDAAAAIRISYDAMREVHASMPGRTWNRPTSIVELMICIDSGQLATEYCETDSVHTTRAMREYFVAGSDLIPTAICPGHGGSHAEINRLPSDVEHLRAEDLSEGYGTGEAPENPGVKLAGPPNYNTELDELGFENERRAEESAREEMQAGGGQ